MPRLILTKSEQKVIRKYLKHYNYELKTNDYGLSEDFVGTTKEDMLKYHLGMRFMVEQMQHELKFIKTPEEYKESIKNDNRIINH